MWTFTQTAGGLAMAGFGLVAWWFLPVMLVSGLVTDYLVRDAD